MPHQLPWETTTLTTQNQTSKQPSHPQTSKQPKPTCFSSSEAAESRVWANWTPQRRTAAETRQNPNDLPKKFGPLVSFKFHSHISMDVTVCCDIKPKSGHLPSQVILSTFPLRLIYSSDYGHKILQVWICESMYQLEHLKPDFKSSSRIDLQRQKGMDSEDTTHVNFESLPWFSFFSGSPNLP